MPELPLSLRYALWVGTLGLATAMAAVSAGSALGLVRDQARQVKPLQPAPAMLRSVPRIVPIAAVAPARQAKAQPAPVVDAPHPAAAVIDRTPHLQVIAGAVEVRAAADGMSRSVGLLSRDDVVDYLALSGPWVLVQRGAVFGWVPGTAMMQIERRPAA